MTLARIPLSALNATTSALGFGCGSLGSRISPRAGLAALARAYEAGVTWFDVAPSYGNGQAESLLGTFLRERPRSSVQVLTKVGVAPTPVSLRAQLLRPVLRTLVAAAPGLRAAVQRQRHAADKLPLDAALIAGSLDASLRRLEADYVDVLALHDVAPEELGREDVLRALETAVASGKARAVAVASSPEAAVTGVAGSAVFTLVQFGNSLLNPGLDRFRSGAVRPVDCVTHSVFGSGGASARIAALIARDVDLRRDLASAGYDGPPRQSATDLLADFAFADNPHGIVLVSMFAGRHLRHNLARHAMPRDAATIRALATRIAAALA